MKKLIILILIILPAVAFAQKRQEPSEVTSVKEFFDKYSEYPGYECLEVNEQMFKQFLKNDDLDQDMVNFLSSLKYIRYLEYKSQSVYSVARTVVGVGSRDGRSAGNSTAKGGNIYFVDGVRVRGEHSAKNDSIAVGYHAGTGTKDNLQQTSDRTNLLYTKAKDEINLSFFTQLMKANKDGEKLLFMKREAGNGYSEYILLSGNTMINIMGDLDINHINQIEEILEAVGEILPL